MYYGELGRSNAGYNPGTAGFAYNLSLTSELTSFLDIRVNSIFGAFTVQEYSTYGRPNFRSEIRTAGVSLTYNFNNFIDSDKRIRPYISAGFEAVEFLSKTDLRNANGQLYNFWSDGTIRDLPEDHEDAINAQMINMDYNYETDLRELDLDGLGHYADRTWSIPVGVGARWTLTPRFHTWVSTDMHFTFTDLIDNISSQGTGNRQGDAANDRFLFTSVGVNYDLNITPKPRMIPVPFEITTEDGEQLLVMIDEDSDKDGVNDFIDKCLGTPEGVEVDAHGCPLDGDKDGVADYMDEEPWTAKGAPVNAEGITITDDEFLAYYHFWIDSLPYPGEIYMAEDFASVEADMTRLDAQYTVQVAAESDGLTQSEINLLLSFRDVISWENDGEKVFLVGQYDQLPDAVARKIELENDGISGSVMHENKGDLVDKTEEALAIESTIRESNPASTASQETLYRVQIGAFRFQLSQDIFAGINDVIAIRGEDGITRYLTGGYESAQEAANRKIELLMNGFEGAFIAAYSGGERITLQSAGMNVNADAKDITYDQENNSIDATSIRFRIQLGAYGADIPTEVLDKYLSLGNVVPQRNSDGTISYYSSTLESYDAAQQYMTIVKGAGINEAIIVGDFNGKIISAEDARNIAQSSNEHVLLGK